MRLCRFDEVERLGSVEVCLTMDGAEVDAFVVYRDGVLRAFLNQCPHTGAQLNWSPNIFLSPEGTHIQCSLHGALFRIEDGFCVYGPCSGESLTPMAVRVEGADVVVASEPGPG